MYCSSVWSNPTNSSLTERLVKLQKRAARVILEVKDILTPTSSLLKSLSWMPINDFYTFRKRFFNVQNSK